MKMINKFIKFLILSWFILPITYATASDMDEVTNKLVRVKIAKSINRKTHDNDSNEKNQNFLDTARIHVRIANIREPQALPEILQIFDEINVNSFVHNFFEECFSTMYTEFPKPKHSEDVLLEMYQCLYARLLEIKQNSNLMDDAKVEQQIFAIKKSIAIPGHLSLFKKHNEKIYRVLSGVQGCMECIKRDL